MFKVNLPNIKKTNSNLGMRRFRTVSMKCRNLVKYIKGTYEISQNQHKIVVIQEDLNKNCSSEGFIACLCPTLFWNTFSNTYHSWLDNNYKYFLENITDRFSILPRSICSQSSQNVILKTFSNGTFGELHPCHKQWLD